jgi:hypothetical protein
MRADLLPWYATGTAIVFIVGTSLYVVFAWRRAPKVYRAMRVVVVVSLVAGLLIGIYGRRSANELMGKVSGEVSRDDGGKGSSEGLASDPCAPDGMSAADWGQAIVLNDQKHASDPNWVPVSTEAYGCTKGGFPPDSALCKGALLGRHALGLDTSFGDNRKCVPLQEVAELCGGDLDAESPFCKKAFELQRQKMRSGSGPR